MTAPPDSKRMAGAGRQRRFGRLTEGLGFERNVVAVAGAMFGMGLAENLWRRFLPKYLQQLGAPVVAIGAFGTAEDLLDSLYQYPGGWIADRFGRRAALLTFIGLAGIGYGLYAAAPSWSFAFLGLTFAMAWTSMASPTLFAVIGDALPRHRRTVGFTVQAVLRRIPIVIAPTVGGLAIARYGVHRGVQLGLVAAMFLAGATLVVAERVRLPIVTAPSPVGVREIWRSFPSPLRWLLASDILIRTCDGLVDVFLVLYALNVIGIGAPEFGLLVAIQATTAMVAYVPAARLADRHGRKPFVVATFLAFAAFPIAVVTARSPAGLATAFAVGGLRELGEPARKALILDGAPPWARARSVGLYYLLRSAAIAPAAVVGGLLWRVRPALPFYVAGGIGLAGVLLFVYTVDERDAA
jgi:MFS family permease